MRLQVGQRVLHFVLERKLGEGGFGEVWRAKAGLASTALKFVSVAGEDLERGRKEYSRVKLMIENGAFNHDRLIKLHGAWLLDEHGEDIPDGVLESAVSARTMQLPDQTVEPDTLLIQMDLAQESLASMLKRIRKGVREEESLGVPVDELLRYIRQAAEGIDFLNTPRTGFDGQIRGAVYHCDIKPENLLLGDGKVRICDYGVARIEGQRKTRSPNALSLAHASPELVDDRPCAQSDQYSLAVSYAQLRTGKLPFKSDVLGGSWRTVMRAVTAGELDLSALEPRERTVVKKATSLNPNKRFRTATDFARELARAVTGHTRVGGEEEGDSPAPRRSVKIPWKTAAAVLVLGGLAGGAYFGRAYLPDFRIDSNENIQFQQAQALFRKHVDERQYDLAEFDRLTELAAQTQQELAKEDLAALEAGVKWWVDLESQSLDRQETVKVTHALPPYLKDSRERIQKYLPKDQADPLVNRIRLLDARHRLREQWPNAAERPSGPLTVFSADTEPLKEGEAPGLTAKEATTLQALRMISAWPADPAQLKLLDAAPRYADVKAKPPAGEELARLESLGKDLPAAAERYISEHGLDETFTAAKIDWAALGIDPAAICLAAAAEKDRAGDQAAAKRLYDSLAAFTGTNSGAGTPAGERRIKWFNAFVELEGKDVPGAIARLDALMDGAEEAELDRLAPMLLKQAVRPLPTFDGSTTWAADELNLLNAAIALCDRAPASERVPSMAATRLALVKQRAVVRLLLPADASNNWAAWRADCEAVQAAAAEHVASPVPLEPFQVTLAELRASASPAVASTFESAGAEALNAKLPSYLAHVEGLSEFAAGKLPAAADSMVAAQAVGAASSARIPGLDWPERRAKATEVLLAAARSMRAPEDRDLSQPPFTAELAAKAKGYLGLALENSNGAAPPDVAALLALATYYSAPAEAPPKLLENVEAALAEDPGRAGVNANGLLLLSARLAASAKQDDLAVDRFGEALSRYEAWAKSAAVNDEVGSTILAIYREALPGADAVFEKASGDSASPLRTRLAAIYGGAALRMVQQALAADSNADRALLAKCFARANALEPRAELVRAEATWLKRFHTGRADAELTRLVELAGKLPQNDPVAANIKAYALYLNYGQGAEPARQAADLHQAIELYNVAIAAAERTGAVDPKLYLERGDSYLQLAYVAHRARAELKENASSIFEYLTQAQQNAQSVIDMEVPKSLHVEALNLWGNSSEDMAYYAVDADKSAWKTHYDQAIEHFKLAYDEDVDSPFAPFNLARCRFRRSVDERRFEPSAAATNQEDLARSVNAVQTALTNWGETDSVKKAEATYWLSEFQESLHKLDDADRSRGEAVAMAERLNDPNWQTYQLQWAALAVQRWIESPPASRDQLKAEATARAMKLFAPAGASAPVRRVDASTAAQAIGLLIQLQKDVDAAVQIVEQNINRFAGTDPVNRACTAQIRLALANRILALRFANSPNFAPLKPKAIAFIDEVLKLTADAESAQRQAVLRSKAHWILGELARTGVDPEKAKEENAKLLNQAREHYRQGIEAINLPDPDLAALSVRLNNVLGYAMSGANLRALTPKEQFRQIAVETDKYLTAIRPQVAGLLPTQVINGDAAANWIEKIDKLSTALKEAAKSP